MTYLIDTNIWLEVLLDQEKSSEVKKFFLSIDSPQLAITEFSLYSIGIILTRLKKGQAFVDFISDILENSGVTRIRLDLADLQRIPAVQNELDLDFDDAYQYLAAQKYDLILVSFDRDFDRTPQGRKTPAEFIS